MKQQQGFTLLELMVALTVSTALLALLYQGVSQSLQQWQRTDSHARTQARNFQRVQLLHHQLAQALRLPATAASPSFVGDQRSLSFVGYLAHPVRGGLYQYRLSQRQSGSDHQLLLLLHPLGHTADTPQAETLELYRGHQPIDIEYATEIDGALHWQNQWQEEKLPRLVRLQSSGNSGWPSQLVELRGAADER